jgi:homoserine kinase
VTARLTAEPGVTVERIFGDNGRLSLLPAENTAAIAATSTLRLAHRTEGVALTIHKGMPLGSGLGSSAASAAAAALAVNLLLGSPLKRSELVAAVLDAEEAVSGRHADNAAPASPSSGASPSSSFMGSAAPAPSARPAPARYWRPTR